MYRCANCWKPVELGKEDPVRCPFCGHKILFKERPRVVKKVKAR
jgi:DNA-directed RNA polymerase subunit P